jgi:parallel beta-helix repeat protein
MRTLTLVLLGLLWASTGWAATYYVATTGNDGAAGTIGAPWRTIQKAANTVAAGDIVNIRGGIYSEYWSSNANGTATNRITFQSYPGETAIVSGSSITPGTQSFLVRVNGDYTTIKNLEIINAAWMSVICWNSATQCIIDGNVIHHGFHTGIVFYQNANNTAQNNHVYDMYDAPRGGNADCIDTSGDSGGPHSYINNVVHDCSDDGLDGWNSTGNTYVGNISYHNGYVPFTSTPSGDGNGYKLGPLGGHTLIDNVAWANRSRGFDDNTGPNNRLYNNTAINNLSVNYRFTVSGAILTNNIAYLGGGNSVSGAVQTTNSWNLGITNPLFIQINDPTHSTFARLQAGSPAIGVGTVVAGSTHTCTGTCDLGAYQFSNVDLTPPAMPTGLEVH